MSGNEVFYGRFRFVSTMRVASRITKDRRVEGGGGGQFSWMVDAAMVVTGVPRACRFLKCVGYLFRGV